MARNAAWRINEMSEKPTDPIRGHRDVYNKWGKDYNYYRQLDYILSAIALISSSIVAAKATFQTFPDSEEIIGILAVVTVIATGWIAKVKPSETADRARIAWALLGNAIDCFDQGEPWESLEPTPTPLGGPVR
jgi:hypothetical protein